MSKVLTKQVQNKICEYFLKFLNYMTKPESRCIREMTAGILKTGTVLVSYRRTTSPVDGEHFLPLL
jgi:hypothetical protein